jgi:hypothetical protein
MNSPVLCQCPSSMSVYEGGLGLHEGYVGIQNVEGGYRGMHVVIVGGGVGMASVGAQDGVSAPHAA